jgi:hypothetical protein
MKKMIIIGLCLALTTLQGFAFGGGGGAGLDDNELYFAYNEKKIIKIFDNPEEAAQYQWVLNKFKYEEASFKKFSLKLEHGNSSDEEIKESMISFKNAFNDINMDQGLINELKSELIQMTSDDVEWLDLVEDQPHYVLMKKVEIRCDDIQDAAALVQLNDKKILLRGNGTFAQKKQMKKELRDAIKQLKLNQGLLDEEDSSENSSSDEESQD